MSKSFKSELSSELQDYQDYKDLIKREIKRKQKKKRILHQSFEMNKTTSREGYIKYNDDQHCHRVGDSRQDPRYWEGEGLDNAYKHAVDTANDIFNSYK